MCCSNHRVVGRQAELLAVARRGIAESREVVCQHLVVLPVEQAYQILIVDRRVLYLITLMMSMPTGHLRRPASRRAIAS
jgi:hypothetical protein